MRGARIRGGEKQIQPPWRGRYASRSRGCPPSHAPASEPATHRGRGALSKCRMAPGLDGRRVIGRLGRPGRASTPIWYACMYACTSRSSKHSWPNMHACMHTYLPTYMHACMHARMHTYIRACMPAYIRAHLAGGHHLLDGADRRACVHVGRHTYVHTLPEVITCSMAPTDVP